MICSLFSKSPLIASYFCFIKLATKSLSSPPFLSSSSRRALPFSLSSISVLSFSYNSDIFSRRSFRCLLFSYDKAVKLLFYSLNSWIYFYFLLFMSLSDQCSFVFSISLASKLLQLSSFSFKLLVKQLIFSSNSKILALNWLCFKL